MDYFKIITLNNKRLAIYKTGEIVFWDIIKNQYHNKGWNIHSFSTDKKGYLRCCVNTKNFKIHRIIAYTFLDLDIENSKLQVDHIDRNKSNNKLENLRIVNNSQNMCNRECKGYSKCNNKFQSEIQINKKKIYLGKFDTEDEARQAYLEAKEIYHNI